MKEALINTVELTPWSDDENMDEEELEGLVWDWKEKSENSVFSSLKKLPVVGDGRAYTNTTLCKIIVKN